MSRIGRARGMVPLLAWLLLLGVAGRFAWRMAQMGSDAAHVVVPLMWVVLYSQCALMLLLLFRRTYPPGGPVLAVAAAWLSTEAHVVHTHLHEFLLRSGFYTHVLPLIDNGFANPQYTKLLVHLTLLGALWTAVCFPKARTPDRLFTAIACTGAMGATLAIHFVLIHGALDFVIAQESKTLEIVNSMAPGAGREHLCAKHGWRCFEGPLDQAFEGAGDLDPRIEKIRAQAAAEPADGHGARRPLTTTWKAGTIDPAAITGNLVSFKSNGRSWRVVVDSVLYQSFIDRWTLLFCALSGAAQSVWTFGGLFALGWHKRRAARKKAAAAPGPPESDRPQIL